MGAYTYTTHAVIGHTAYGGLYIYHAVIGHTAYGGLYIYHTVIGHAAYGGLYIYHACCDRSHSLWGLIHIPCML